MNDAQIWTLIGGFLAVMVAFAGLVLRTVKAEIAVLAVKIDHLDRDVQALVSRMLGN